MFTWISRTGALLFATLPLTACDETGGLPFAADLGAIAERQGRTRLANVGLAGGDIVLSAPDGYCIDRQTLRRLGPNGFAVIARCDTMGVPGGFGGFDLAIITVTTARQQPGSSAPTPSDVARSAGSAKVLDTRSRDGLALVRFGTGGHAVEGVSDIHWRGAFALNGHLVGIGLYAPDGSDALGSGGMSLLRDLARRTRDASAAKSIATATPATPPVE